MNKTIISALVVLLVIVGGAIYINKMPKKMAVDPNAVVSSRTSSVGTYLTDTKGMTLYTYKDDKLLESACADECLKTWPVFEYNNKDLTSSTDPLSKNLNVLTRKDGWRQFAYQEMPLYYYVGDKVPGDVNGNGLNDKWGVVLINN